LYKKFFGIRQERDLTSRRKLLIVLVKIFIISSENFNGLRAYIFSRTEKHFRKGNAPTTEKFELSGLSDENK
jgi:hypothetical protein